MSSFSLFFIVPGLILHYIYMGNCLQLYTQCCLFVAHMVWWLLWNSNLHYTAAPGSESKNSLVGCRYWVKHHEIWTQVKDHLSICQNETLACTIVTKVQAKLGPGGMDPSTWRAAEVQKKQDMSLLGSSTLGEQHTHVYITHTHTCSQPPVDSCKNSTRTQLGPQYTHTFTTTFVHYPSKDGSLRVQATSSSNLQ